MILDLYATRVCNYFTINVWKYLSMVKNNAVIFSMFTVLIGTDGDYFYMIF